MPFYLFTLQVSYQTLPGVAVEVLLSKYSKKDKHVLPLVVTVVLTVRSPDTTPVDLVSQQIKSRLNQSNQ